MTDVPPAHNDGAGALLTCSDTPPEVPRRADLAAKLAAIVSQLQQIAELERPDVEPAPPMPVVWDDDARR